ncbi:MAG: N-formylglutamate amidohydrolase [Afipia sp. 62-7]|nr:N-formylglutamate amidohydrolase [Afipia sp.]OJU19022.1 MAG: N-formylglutamate amidohydrolase [Afipia sp. 62-7]
MTLPDPSDTLRLIAPDEVPPVLEENAQSRSPFFFTCDHYGRLIPRVLGDLGVSASELERHIAWDIGIAGVATLLAKELGVHLIAQRYSRLVIDCNRPFSNPGSIPLISEATEIPGNGGLTKEQIAARQQAVFAPYHARIAQALDARKANGLPTILVSLHSFTPVYAGIARPWHVGTLYHRDDRLPHMLRDLLRKEGDLVVGDNEPYAVSDATDYTIPVHAEQRRLMHTGIEIRQDLIGDQSGQREWAERLARLLREIEDTLHADKLMPAE